MNIDEKIKLIEKAVIINMNENDSNYHKKKWLLLKYFQKLQILDDMFKSNGITFI